MLYKNHWCVFSRFFYLSESHSQWRITGQIKIIFNSLTSTYNSDRFNPRPFLNTKASKKVLIRFVQEKTFADANKKRPSLQTGGFILSVVTVLTDLIVGIVRLEDEVRSNYTPVSHKEQTITDKSEPQLLSVK